MDLGFPLNYTNLYLIDVTPDGPERTGARLAAGITTVEVNDSDETVDSSYYDGEGVSSTDVTGSTMGYSISGERRVGNRAQDFIASLRGSAGSARNTHLRHIGPDGSYLEGVVTLTDIKAGGGDANAKGTFECTATFKGRPTYTPGDKDQVPETVTCTAATVEVGKTALLEPTVTPAAASGACAYAVDDPEVATVDDDGTVHGVKAGKCRVSVKAMAAPTVACIAEVTVTEAAGD